MKIRWIAFAVVMAISAPAHAQNTAGVIAHQDGSNTFTSSVNDFLFQGAVATPPTPTAAAGATSGGSCSTATYRFYTSYENATGETDLSHTSIEFTPASGSTNLITVTRGAIGANVYTWSAWFTTSTESHRIVHGCGALGAVADTAAATSTASCLCSTTTTPTARLINTTRDVYAMRIYAGPGTMGTDIGGILLKPDPASGQLVAYSGTRVVARITPSGIIPGDCPTDLYALDGGAECYEPTTGLRMTRDDNGVHAVTP